ncbi:MAG: aspartate/glutamate racemase family protein [Terracidiphilus sp.]
MTPDSQFELEPEVLEAPVQRFQHYKEAILTMAGYEAALSADAFLRRSNGLPVTDQDQPDEVFCLFPADPDRAPLAIIGGMGPLAGSLAFRQACARFQDSRSIVLFQACSMPDRSTVILGEGSPDTPLCHEVAFKLASAVRLAVDLAGPTMQPASCILACNSAHYFWRLMMDDLGDFAEQVQMISLVGSSVEALRSLSCKKALLLMTEGAQIGKVFSTPCRDAGIAFDDPSPMLTSLLMSAVFEGIKSLDERRAVEIGNELFETILQSGDDYDCVLAGCTELPLTIDLLRLRGNPAVADFLSRVKIVDPVEEALRHA